MDSSVTESTPPTKPKWKKVVYGGMQPGFDDNHSDESFLEEMVTNANVVKRDLLKAMQDSVSISQYLCIVALTGLVWTYTIRSTLTENSLLLLDVTLLGLGFLILLLTQEMLSFNLLLHYLLNVSFFTSGLYLLAPIYRTLTRSISSDSILALTVSLLLLHLFFHDYFGSTVRTIGALNSPTLTSSISLNASIVASVFIASRLPSTLLVFAIMHFSLQVFLFAPLVVKVVEQEKDKMEVFIKSATRREAMLEKKCGNQQGLIRAAHANLKKSERKVEDLRAANVGLAASLEEARFELFIVQSRVTALSHYLLSLKRRENLESMMQYREQKGPMMNALCKFEREAQRNQYHLFLQQGLLKVDDPEMKRTLDCYYEESSTEESDVASTSSDKSYEEVDSE
ncbi:hypothetical protein ACLB2K_004814 [Fragaria x ananassa]